MPQMLESSEEYTMKMSFLDQAAQELLKEEELRKAAEHRAEKAHIVEKHNREKINRESRFLEVLNNIVVCVAIVSIFINFL